MGELRVDPPQAKQAFQVQSYAPRPSIDGVQIIELKRTTTTAAR